MTGKRLYMGLNCELGHVDEAGLWRNLDIDPQTTCLVVIDNEHHHIHEGLAWSITETATLGNGESTDYIFITPDSDWLVHLRYEVVGEGEGSVSLFEDATTGVGGGGTAITKADFSLNRDDPQTGFANVYTGATVATTGARRRYFAFGSARNAGGVNAEHEIILARNTTYLLRITSDAVSNEVAWNIFWYEHSRNEIHE
jgi:hypothetical protein